MPSRSFVLMFGIVLLAITAIVLAAVAWARVNEFSLPLPAALPALNVLLPVLTAVVWVVSRRFLNQVRKHVLRLALSMLAYSSTLAPFALFVLSLMYATPSDIRSCAADQQWLRMFENKDERGIRTIQTRLQCCGFNSIHDRAWPFPSRAHDARACERTLGYTVACGNLWRQEEVFAAALTALASFLNWLMVLAVVNFPESEGQIRLPVWTPQHTRLIENGAESAEREDRNRGSSGSQAEHSAVWDNNAESGA